MKGNSLWIIVPCYNEEEVILGSSKLLLNKMKSLESRNLINRQSRILFVDDGSKDRTWEIILELSKKDDRFIGISQSRNFGHQNTVLAGLMEARLKCDITITVDCDGQDDFNAIDEMVYAYQEGYEVVYGVRSNRKKDSFLKKNTAEIYYRILRFLGGEIIYNHADFRLVSSKVLDKFSEFGEVNLFLRGLFPLVGFKSKCVYYERKERMAGKTHYSLGKMCSLALNGITSLSIRPIRAITILGFISSLIGFIGIIYAIVLHFMNNTISGWTSMACMICFMGGIQLLCLGIIGEYIGKIYLETKRRPRYIICERTWEEEKYNQGN